MGQAASVTLAHPLRRSRPARPPRSAPAGLLVTAALALLVAACGPDGSNCNNECPAGFHCDSAALACVPDDQSPDAGSTRCDADTPCAAPTQCERDSGRCVECLDGSHCDTGRCHPVTFTCRPAGCQRQADCAADPEKPFCGADGDCVACRADVDCPTIDGLRRTCDRVVGACVANPCRRDADCATDSGGRLCDVGSGVCVECVTDEHCPTGRCLGARRACVPCLEDADCDTAAAEVCDVATNQCLVSGCVSNAQCVGPGRCDPVAHACRVCVVDADCAFGGACDAGVCVDPAACAIDSDCLFGRLCATGACAECRGDGDCRAGQRCDAGLCAEPGSCTAGTDCRAGRSCTAGACAPDACAADAFEPNDSAGQPTLLDPGTVSATLCPNEVDHYALEVLEGAGAEVTLRFASTAPAPVLELVYDGGIPQVVATGALLSPGILAATVETLPTGRGSLLVRVSGGGGVALAYELTTRVERGGLCVDDAREDDDEQVQAVPATPGVFDGVLCPTRRGQVPEEDWLVLDVPEGNRVVASLTLAPGSPEQVVSVEIYTFVNGGRVLDTFGATLAVGQRVAGPGGQRFWVVVRNPGTRKIPYSLTVSVSPKPPSNDRCTAPQRLTASGPFAGTTRGAVNDGAASCGGDGPDAFWSLELTEASRVRLELDAPFAGVLSLAAGCNGPELACVTGGARPVLTFDALPSGTYLVRVDAHAGEGPYVLDLQLAPADPPPAGETCELAPELAFASDVALANGTVARAADDFGATCGAVGGDALFALELDVPRRVRARLEAFAGASLSLVSADGCGTGTGAECAAAAVREADGASVAELDRLALPAGRWLFVVDGGTSRAGAFALRVELSEPLYAPENDACGGVIPLVDAATGDTRGGADDFRPQCAPASHTGRDAVYRYSVFGDSEVAFTLDATFDAALVVTADPCGTGPVLACADGRNISISLPILTTNDYYVWVDGYEGASGTYALSVTRRDAEPVPANDTCADATAVPVADVPVELTGSTRRATNDSAPTDCRNPGAAAGSPALALSGPDVAYAVEIPAGRTLRATLRPDGWDGALYALDGCADLACAAASDRSFLAGGEERLDVSNPDADARTVRIVVDAWQAGSNGPFGLTLELL